MQADIDRHDDDGGLLPRCNRLGRELIEHQVDRTKALSALGVVAPRARGLHPRVDRRDGRLNNLALEHGEWSLIALDHDRDDTAGVARINAACRAPIVRVSWSSACRTAVSIGSAGVVGRRATSATTRVVVALNTSLSDSRSMSE